MKTQPGWLIPTWGKRTLLIFQQGTGKHQDWHSTKEQPGKQTHTWEGAKPREELACTAHKRHRESQQSPGSHFQRTQKPLESGRELQESPGNCLKRTKSHQVRQGITRITWKFWAFPAPGTGGEPRKCSGSTPWKSLKGTIPAGIPKGKNSCWKSSSSPSEKIRRILQQDVIFSWV